MQLITISQQIMREMWMYKLRSLLAMFCISFGTLIVVMLLALGTGFHDASLKKMLGIVDGAYFVLSGYTSKNYNGYPKGRPIHVTLPTVMNVKNVFPDIQYISPEFEGKSNIVYKNKKFTKNLHGVSADFAFLRKINLEPNGRFFANLDINENIRVAVLGEKLKNSLFGEESALNKIVLINSVPFNVIGVIPETGRKGHGALDDDMIIPYNEFVTLFGNKWVQIFILKPNPNVDYDLFEQSLRTYFADRYSFDKTDKEALHFFNTGKIYQFVRWFFIGIQLFLGACGVMTLGVGCIGVANIMFLIVIERTREIGLRKAIGAADWQILLQLLLEALIIVIVGGGLGFIVAYLITFVLQFIDLPEWLGTPVISYITVIATVTILTLVGLIAGFFPARRAAKMDPVEALML